MQLQNFKVEQWMTQHEMEAAYNLTDTCIYPYTYDELVEMDHSHLLYNLKLDYGQITGAAKLKDLILKLYITGTQNNITVTQGCSQANEMVMNELLDKGDHVITFGPGYESFINIPESIGCDVSILPLYEKESWQPHFKDVEAACRSNTKMIIINNPNNPTGTLFSRDFLNQLISFADERNLWIISDEVYRLPENPSISDLYEKGISTSSLSKMYALSGLRLGWIKGPQNVIERINVRRDYSIISTGPLIDALGCIALQNSSAILDRTRNVIAVNKGIVRTWLLKEKRADVILPSAGTVCFLQYKIPMESCDLSEALLSRYGVFFVPGWCFDYEYHLRLGLTQEPEIMQKGLELFSKFMDEQSS